MSPPMALWYLASAEVVGDEKTLARSEELSLKLLDAFSDNFCAISSRLGVGGNLNGEGPVEEIPELIRSGSSSMVPHVIISGSFSICDMLGVGVEETNPYPLTFGVSDTSPLRSIVISKMHQ